ncbi:MAG TPA: S9 family peptidase [Phnomibacter sp.]|nr:S9 family peptidase [Phnomibacter sp.]
MKRKFHCYAVLILVLFQYPVRAQQGTETIKVTDLLEVRNVGNVSLSPDGRRVAYTLTSIITDEKNAGEYRYQSQVWVAQTTAPFAQQQFTTAADGAGQPAWSPDGNRLAFVRAVDNTPQIFLASLGGGEPVQLTRIPYGATNPVWSPDGRLIAFSVSMPQSAYANDSVYNPANKLPAYSLEKPGRSDDHLKKSMVKPDANGTLEQVRAYLARNEQDKKAKVIHKLNFQQEAVTSGEMNVNHVFIIAPVPGAKPKAVTGGHLSFSNPQFVAGTPLLVVEAPLFTDRHPDRAQERAIYSIDTSGAGLKMLLGDSGRVYSGATVSPSGKWLAYSKGITSFVNVPELYVQPLQPGASTVKVDLDRNKGNLTWTADDRFLYFTSPSNGGVVLHRYEPAKKQLTRMSSYDEGIASYDVKGNTLVYARHAVSGPAELYLSDAEMKNARQVSSHNSWVKDRQISYPEKFTFRNELGQEVEYWVMKPVGFEPGKKYPLLLQIHGGPTAMWGPGEAGMWHEYQYFCSKGYGVVYCNPRGSGGYGEAFMRSNINDWGNGPMRDVLQALEGAVAQGWADTSKLLVTGGSYAGYLVAYILGHDQRFAAACAQRGVYDLRTFFGEGNAWRLVPNYFGGYPWEKATYDILERESPINYVQNIRTPLIIFHGEQDLRTGVIQSEQLYKSLKVLGRPVEYVRHPGATHEITRSGNNRQRIDQMLRTWEFFERFIGKGN